MRPQIIYEPHYKGYEVKVGRLGNRKEVLDAILNILNYMWRKTSRRIYLCHFQLKTGQEEHQPLMKSLRAFRKEMHRKGIATEYLWVREFGRVKDDTPHYHIMIATDEDSVQSFHSIRNRLSELMTNNLEFEFQKFHACAPQNDAYGFGKKVTYKADNFADGINWMSYLAKVSKKKLPRHKRSFDFTKGYLIPPKIASRTRKYRKTPSLPKEQLTSVELYELMIKEEVFPRSFTRGEDQRSSKDKLQGGYKCIY